jgi:hypothetical protein
MKKTLAPCVGNLKAYFIRTKGKTMGLKELKATPQHLF